MPDEEHIHLPHEDTVIQYMNREKKKAGISEGDIAEALSLDQSNVSRLLRKERRLRYEEAYELVLLILKHISSIPNEPVKNYCTTKVETVYSDEQIFVAAKKMLGGDFTQLPVIDRKTEKCVGIVTDWAFLRRMLNPIKSGSKETWLREMAAMRIEDAEVIDEVPKYAPDCALLEVAEGLMHHYAVIIEEEMGTEIGIITRADMLELFG